MAQFPPPPGPFGSYQASRGPGPYWPANLISRASRLASTPGIAAKYLPAPDCDSAASSASLKRMCRILLPCWRNSWVLVPLALLWAPGTAAPLTTQPQLPGRSMSRWAAQGVYTRGGGVCGEAGTPRSPRIPHGYWHDGCLASLALPARLSEGCNCLPRRIVHLALAYSCRASCTMTPPTAPPGYVSRPQLGCTTPACSGRLDAQYRQRCVPAAAPTCLAALPACADPTETAQLWKANQGTLGAPEQSTVDWTPSPNQGNCAQKKGFGGTITYFTGGGIVQAVSCLRQAAPCSK